MHQTPVIVLLVASLSLVLGVPEPVDQLIAAAYLGNWYQVYTNQYVMNTSQRNATCVTINYGFYDDGVVSVDNRFRQYTPDGAELQTTGKATVVSPGVLEVKFDNIPGMFDYRVVKLGPLTSMRQYSYAVVTNDEGTNLNVLARSVSDFMDGPKDEVMQFLEENGYEPIETLQDSSCEYPTIFEPPQLVPEVDLEAYSGKWFLAYNNLNIDNRVSKDSKCSTVDYVSVNATMVNVFNTFRVGSPTGKQNTTGTGYALTTDDPAVLAVYFFDYPGLVFDYRVIKLGPIKDGKYEYTVDTDRFKSSVFVLVRDLATFQEMYEEEVLEWVRDQGFNGPTSQPFKQYQGDDCLYPEGFEYTTAGASQLFASFVLMISALWVSL